jgi:prevent-host-death family protein
MAEMRSVGVRELKEHTSELIRRLRKNGEQIQITYRGEVVALLIPVAPPSTSEESQAWAELDNLAAEIGARWPEGLGAPEAVAEGRR